MHKDLKILLSWDFRGWYWLKKCIRGSNKIFEGVKPNDYSITILRGRGVKPNEGPKKLKQ